jgi:hypothetical protein
MCFVSQEVEPTNTQCKAVYFLNISEGKLIKAEETNKGKVTFHTYRYYIQAAGGVIVSAFVVLIYIISIAVSTGTSWWLSYWLQQGGGVSSNSLFGNEN